MNPRLFCPPRNATAALLFGAALPNPQPPSRVCAMMAPAQSPDLNPQQPEAQSASLAHAPVMNCLAAALPMRLGFAAAAARAPVGGVAGAAVGAAGVADVTATAAFTAAAVGAGPVKPRATAALSFGVALPNPQPPSRCCATTAPAQSPVLKPQHPEAQSASLAHAPVMNCLAAALPIRLGFAPAAARAPVGGDTAATAAAAATATGEVAAPLFTTVDAATAPVGLKPSAIAAFALGEALPWPHPPSRCCATTGPAQRPVLNPQQAEAQSLSELQGPVMNCVPAPRAGTETILFC
jgi:hypothetical protein